MNIKKGKFGLVFLCVVMLCMCLAGCGGSNVSKRISVNMLASTMTFTKVSYYDFNNEKYVSNYSGKCSVMSNTLTSTEIWFTDEDGETRAACVNTKLSERPKSVRVYTNEKKTKYDTYKCEY